MNLLHSFSRAGLAAGLLLLLAAPASRAQTLYVGNESDNTVRSFSLATGVATPGFNVITLTGDPDGLALSGNALYATDFTGNTLSAYDATTGVALAGFTTVTGLANPTSVVFAGGTLYVANWGGGNITAYDATSGAAVAGYVSPSGLSQPYGLAISGSTLYVATVNQVRAFNLATGVAVPGFTPITLGKSYGLTLISNALYAISFSGSTLGAYDATTGTPLGGFTTETSANGLASPAGLAALGGTLYVANNTGANITAYDATTGAQVAYTSPSGLNHPAAFAISNVPEPGSALLLGLGTGLLASRRRRS